MIPRVLGADTDGSATRFGLFTTTARRCAVRLYAPGGGEQTHAMMGDGDGGFTLTLPGVGPGARYHFVLDDRALPDPWARFLPDGVHGPAMVTRDGHAWRAPAGSARPLDEQVIYELHVGTFTPEGTYAAAAARLDALVALGVTTLELMPVAAFAGQRGWGYDGVAHYAPFAPYGPPDALRAFVDEAHQRGLAVLLDVVYNHFGPSGAYLGAYCPACFTDRHQTPWGAAPDFTHPLMRRHVLDNARYWLESFRFDGLRLDATHSIFDDSPIHLFDELAARTRALGRPHVLVAEDDRNEAALVTRHGLDAIWADDFHHQLHVTLTGERDGYYAAYTPGAAGLARAIEQGWLYQGEVSPVTGRPRGTPAGALPAAAFVYCLQNHDQVGNRALGTRLHHDASLDAWAAASVVLLFLPMTPLLFMGQEWAASSPFLYFTDHDPELGRLVSEGRRAEFAGFTGFSDPARRAAIPDPQAPETFTRSRLDWAERDREPHARVLGLYRDLLALRRGDPVLRHANRAALTARADGELLVVERRHGAARRVLLANFGDERPIAELKAGLSPLLASRADLPADRLPRHAAAILA